jgi:hypothetical protein
MIAYLDQLRQDMVMTAVAFGMPEPQARALAATLIDRIQTNHAGDAVFIPGPNKHRRNEHIRRMFNGVNHDTVAGNSGSAKRRCIGWWDKRKAAKRFERRLTASHRRGNHITRHKGGVAARQSANIYENGGLLKRNHPSVL